MEVGISGCLLISICVCNVHCVCVHICSRLTTILFGLNEFHCTTAGLGKIHRLWLLFLFLSLRLFRISFFIYGCVLFFIVVVLLRSCSHCSFFNYTQIIAYFFDRYANKSNAMIELMLVYACVFVFVLTETKRILSNRLNSISILAPSRSAICTHTQTHTLIATHTHTHINIRMQCRMPVRMCQCLISIGHSTSKLQILTYDFVLASSSLRSVFLLLRLFYYFVAAILFHIHTYTRTNTNASFSV